MDLDIGEIRRAAGQALGRRAVVVDRQIARADFGALGRRARPGLVDDDVAGLEFLRERGRAAEREQQRQSKQMFHAGSPLR